MIHADAPGLLLGAVALGLVHGVEPGHGWPVAAAYAMDRSNAWAAGFAASLLIGVGHLISSIAVVFAYFYAIAYFDLTSLDEPVVLAGVPIGGPLGIVAGILLIGLGIREYYGSGRGHVHERDDPEQSHADEDDHSNEAAHEHEQRGDEHCHDHGGGLKEDRDGRHEENRDSGHEHDRDAGHVHGYDATESGDHDRDDAIGHSHEHERDEDRDAGWRSRIGSALPFGGGHEHLDASAAQDRGLLGIAWVAFVLGFAHEEEFEIIALCTGSTHCLELMLAYAITVVAGIVALTMLLVAGYQHYEERVERIVPYLPAFSAVVLIAMGLGFVLGLL